MVLNLTFVLENKIYMSKVHGCHCREQLVNLGFKPVNLNTHKIPLPLINLNVLRGHSVQSNSYTHCPC